MPSYVDRSGKDAPSGSDRYQKVPYQWFNYVGLADGLQQGQYSLADGVYQVAGIKAKQELSIRRAKEVRHVVCQIDRLMPFVVMTL